jgi:hypothetical protein
MAKRKKKPKEWIALEPSGPLNVAYEISDGQVTVRCIHGKKSAELRGLPGEQLAKHLLSEMVRNPSSADPPHCPRTRK